MGASGPGNSPPLEAWSCGYCGKSDSFCAQGLTTHSLTVHDYQLMLNRGWVRSGKYLYKATMPVTCCPTYPMRCHVLDFQASRSQRQVLKRMRKYLTMEGTSGKPAAEVSSEPQTLSRCEEGAGEGRGELELNQTGNHFPLDPTQPWPGDDTDSSIQARHKTRAAQPTSPARVSPAPARACPPPRTPRPRPSHTESFEQLMSGSTEPAQQRLEVKLLKLCPPSPELQTSFRESYNVYKRYQMHVHKDTEEMASEAEYRRFFCSTPLLGEEPVDGPDTGYGSFIEQFLLDGKIIALGLLDILPEGINSQYLCYDPAYSFLSLGVYSALREIALTQRLHKKAPRMKYYYLGPYVHSCIKVKYKLQYQPAELLCPVTGRWVFAEKCLSKLEESKYTRLYEREDADVVSGLSDEDLWFFRNFLDALSPSPSASLQTEEAMLVVSQEDLVSTHSSQGWWRQHSCLARFLSCCCVTCRRRETQS
eukprot:gi/632956954/ref/XP_007894217.1/ PREDICTED: arginyl-tRNA--protein transferase 1-like isoform X1 [Callorhinchus milii]